MNRNPCSSGRRPRRAAAAGGTPRPHPAPTSRPCTRRRGRSGRAALSALLLLAALLLAPAPGSLGAAGPDCPQERDLCVQAERSGGIDLKSGVARLEGSVQGYMRSRDLTFTGHLLTAYRESGQEWDRLVLEQNVSIQQAGKAGSADHGIVERDEVRLSGNVRIVQDELQMDGQEATVHAGHSGSDRTTVEGSVDAPITIVVKRALLQRPAAEAQGAAENSAAEPVVTTMRALKAVVDGEPRHVNLTGDVRIEQSDGGLSLSAQHVMLVFGADSALQSFRAEGDVSIAQPDRRVAADVAQSRNALNTILLVGHALVQQTGQFDLRSERMEIFADSERGVVQSQDRQKPITLSMDLSGKSNYGLNQQSMLALTKSGVPVQTLEKLAPLIGVTYPTRAALRDAVAARLTSREVERHLDAILAATGR